MGLVIGLICVAVVFLLLYIILLGFFCGAAGMLLAVFPILLLLLVFYLVKISTPSSYGKLAKKALAEAARKDAEEVEKKRREIKMRVDSQVEENNKKISLAKEQLDRVNKRIEECHVIPEYYIGIRDVIAAYIRCGRADSVKQAINLYEKEKLTAEVIDAEYRASKAKSVDEMKKEAFMDAKHKAFTEEMKHEAKMMEKEERRQGLQLENDLLKDELERGRKNCGSGTVLCGKTCSGNRCNYWWVFRFAVFGLYPSGGDRYRWSFDSFCGGCCSRISSWNGC